MASDSLSQRTYSSVVSSSSSDVIREASHSTDVNHVHRGNRRSQGSQHSHSRTRHRSPRGTRYNRSHDRAKIQLMERLRSNYSDIPAGAYVSEMYGPLAKVTIRYGVESDWRGAIIDYEKLLLVKRGTDMRNILLEDGDNVEDVKNELLRDYQEATGVDAVTSRTTPVLGGTFVSVFKYDGIVYYSYGRTLGSPDVYIPEGGIDVREKLLEILPEGTIESLFDESIHTYTACYEFIVLDNATLDVTQAPLAVPSVIFNGVTRLEVGVRGSPRVGTIDAIELTNEEPYPTAPGVYSNKNVSYDSEEAQAWFDGYVTGAPEELLVNYKSDGFAAIFYRIQPISSEVRHLIRGDVGSIAIRLTQAMGEYEVVDGVGQFSLQGRDGRVHFLEEIEGVRRLTTLEKALAASLPHSRRDELTDAIRRVNILQRRLYGYFTGPPNDKHPLRTEYERLHKLRGKKLADAIWQLSPRELYHSMRWYRLI